MKSPTVYSDYLRYLPTPIFKFLAKRWINYDFPRHLFIELNTSCNLSCAICPRQKMNKEMDYDLFRKIVKEANGIGRFSFSLHLFGEPLLGTHFYDAIRELKQGRHTVIITTNGTLLQEHRERLLQSGIDRIIISYRKGLDTKSILQFRSIATIRVFRNEEGDARAEFPGFHFQVKDIHNYGGSIKSGSPKLKRHPCYHLWLAPAVRWNGEFTVCCADPYGEMVVGNVKKRTIGEMWNGTLMNNLRKWHLNGIYDGRCKNCNVWSTYPSIL